MEDSPKMIGSQVVILDKDKKETTVTILDKINKTNEKNQQYDAYVGKTDEGTSHIFSPYDIKKFL